MQRKRKAYQEYGYSGLFDQRRGKRSYHRVAMETAELVLTLYPDKYPDFNVRGHTPARRHHHRTAFGAGKSIRVFRKSRVREWREPPKWAWQPYDRQSSGFEKTAKGRERRDSEPDQERASASVKAFDSLLFVLLARLH